MKKNTTSWLVFCSLLLSVLCSAQIGIGTTIPNAQLDIRSSNQATPNNTDGVIIPKIDAFPVTSPTAAQQGMLVYLTTISGGNPPGFYYWDGVSTWEGIASSSSGDSDWYKVGTTTPPLLITDDMFHTGNVAIGKNTAVYPLEISTSAFNIGVNNAFTSATTNASNKIGLSNTISGSSNDANYGVYNTLNGSGTGNHFGNYTTISSSGNGTHSGSEIELSGAGNGGQYAVSNTIINTGNGTHFGTVNRLNGTGSGDHYALYNVISGSGTGNQYGNYTSIANTAANTQYGSYTTISGNGFGGHTGNYNLLSGSSGGVQTGTYNEITNTAGSSHYGSTSNLSGSGAATKYGFYATIPSAAGGTHYGFYSDATGAGNYAGYFLGNVSIGSTTLNTYTFPASRGTNGQTLKTDAVGNVSWANNSDFAWSLNGNNVLATDFIGTTNAQPFRFYCNNQERFRINPTDGEIVAGATASPYAGDLLNAVSTATLTFALNGYSSQNGSGTWGETMAASATNFSAVQGVYGGSGIGAGVLGNYNGTNAGTLRAGTIGICQTPAAAGAGVGVYGSNNIASGNQRMGVYGTYNGAAFGLSVVGVAFGGGIPAGNQDIAVVGWRANNGNYSGYFNGNHVIANGTKSASVGTSKGNQLLYVTETPEVWFEDIGGGQLENGSTHIQLDDLFLETIFVDSKHPMRIFLQEEGESNGLIVIKDSDNKGFTVKEKNGGTSSISFSYRIMAKRLHFQDHRFGNDPVWGEGDTRKYNQYATPPPVDYAENVRFQEQQKKNYKPTPMPKGFIDYMTLQKEGQQFELTKKETNKALQKKN